MTTYTLTGLTVFYNPTTDNPVDVGDGTVTLELVVPGSTTSFSYTTNPARPGDEPGDETVSITVTEYTLRIDGQRVATSGSTAPEFSIFEVDWTDAGNVARTSTILVPFLEGVSGPGPGVVDADYIFVINGAPLPAFSSVAQWNTFNDASITDIGVPVGTYGPGTAIALTSLGATVSQNDIITGTNGRDVFKSGAGNDVVSGRGGNDKLIGGGGRDRLDGGKGNDKLVGGGAKDRLDGGAGNDRLIGGGGRDKLDGGKGNDKMTGGGGKDIFIFGRGQDEVTDFDTASNREKIDLSGVGAITGFKNLKNNFLAETGGNTVIDDGAGNTMTLNGVSISDLDKGDFIF